MDIYIYRYTQMAKFALPDIYELGKKMEKF